VITHIVMWKLAAEDEQTKAHHAEEIRDALESLVGVVDEIVSLKVVRDTLGIPGSWDLVLIGEYDTEEALAAYQSHPAHQAAAAVVRERVAERASVDFEH
jgi:quinol monooxygenase YgiN